MSAFQPHCFTVKRRSSLKEAPYYPYILWVLAAVFYFYEFIHRIIPSVLTTEWMLTFSANAGALGQLSASYFYTYALLQIPLGILFDCYPTHILLSLASLTVALGSIILASTEVFVSALVARCLIGAASAFAFIGCLRIIQRTLPFTQQARFIGLTNALGVVGALAGGPLLASLLKHCSWQKLMLISTLFGMVLSFMLAWGRLPEHNKSLSPKGLPAVIKKLPQLLNNSATWGLGIFAGLMVAPMVCLAELWDVPFLCIRYGFSTKEAASLVSWVFIGVAIGGPLIGWLEDRWQKPWILMRFGAGIATLATIILFYGPLLSKLSNGFWHLLLGMASSSMLLCFSLPFKSTLPRSSRIALLNTMAMLGGAVFQPLIGTILDSRGSYQVSDFQLAFLSLPLCQISAFILSFVLSAHPEYSTMATKE